MRCAKREISRILLKEILKADKRDNTFHVRYIRNVCARAMYVMWQASHIKAKFGIV